MEKAIKQLLSKTSYSKLDLKIFSVYYQFETGWQINEDYPYLPRLVRDLIANKEKYGLI